MIHIRPVNAENIDYVANAAASDGHRIVHPSDVVVKDGKVLGYVGIATVPCLTMWMHTKDAKVRDSMTVLSFVEGMLARNNIKEYFLPCESASPYHHLLEKAGFVQTNYDKLFIRKIQ